MKHSILLIDDDKGLCELLHEYFSAEGFNVAMAHTGTQGLSQALKEDFDVILLDVMLPEMDGFEVLKAYRAEKMTPIIMLTAKGDDFDRIFGLELGADDYVTKPFSSRELLSRIKAVLRRTQGDKNKSILVEGLALDPVSHRITADERPVEMGPTEYRLLEFFMTHQDRAYSRAQLLDQVWGGNVYVEDRTVDVHILRLRKLLAPYQSDEYIQTVRGEGYRFSKI